MTLEIEYVDWTTLRPHPDNPRVGDTDAIAESVRASGVYRPIICASDGTILAGTHLYEVLGTMGGGQVAVVRLPHHPDSEAAHRILLADNRTADRAAYDDGLLHGLLTEMAAQDALWGTGFDTDDLGELSRALQAAEHTPLDWQLAATQDEESGSKTRAAPTLPPRDRVLPTGSPSGPPTMKRYLTIGYEPDVHHLVIEALDAYRAKHGLHDHADAVLRLLGLFIEGAP